MTSPRSIIVKPAKSALGDATVTDIAKTGTQTLLAFFQGQGTGVQASVPAAPPVQVDNTILGLPPAVAYGVGAVALGVGAWLLLRRR